MAHDHNDERRTMNEKPYPRLVNDVPAQNIDISNGIVRSQDVRPLWGRGTVARQCNGGGVIGDSRYQKLGNGRTNLRVRPDGLKPLHPCRRMDTSSPTGGGHLTAIQFVAMQFDNQSLIESLVTRQWSLSDGSQRALAKWKTPAGRPRMVVPLGRPYA